FAGCPLRDSLLTRYRARNAFLTRYHAPGGLSPRTLATSAEVQVGRSGLRSPATARTVSHTWGSRSEEHTSELQSRFDLVCRLLPPPALHPLSLHDALPICFAGCPLRDSLLTRYRARNAFLTRYHAPGGLSPRTLATSAEVQVGRSGLRSPATARTVSHTWGS